MQIPVFNMAGDQVEEYDLPDAIFGAKINIPLMHQAYVRQMANARQGTHSTKTRGENNRTKAKWYRQKGTGRARHGSRNAPIFVGGGIAHGPRPRKYTKKMPRKMRRAALRSALSAVAAEQQIVLVDSLKLDAPSTRQMNEALTRLAGSDSILLVLPGDSDEVVEKSARNLARVKILKAGYLNIRDLLQYDRVVVPLEALEVIQLLLG